MTLPKHPSEESTPFSEKTEKQRRNALLMCLMCLFIGISGQFPQKFALLGLTFDQGNQELIGWFILIISFILFLNFTLSAVHEGSHWLKALILPIAKEKAQYKQLKTSESQELAEYRAYEEDQDEQLHRRDLNKEFEKVNKQAEYDLDEKFSFLKGLFYIRLALDFLLPCFICFFGLMQLLQRLLN